jgi:sec-independent protein translocase protein TatA
MKAQGPGGAVVSLEIPGLLMLSPGDIILVVVVFLVLFGGKKIPELAKGLGQGIRNFKGAVKTDEPPAESKQESKQLDQ